MTRPQILGWHCRGCEKWVAIEVQPDISPRCPSCGTEKALGGAPAVPGQDSRPEEKGFKLVRPPPTGL